MFASSSPTLSKSSSSRLLLSKERRMEMVDIIIVDSSGEEILKTSIHSNLYIKQVKYDIYRTKFITVSNPLEAFTLYHNGKVVENNVCIRTLLEDNRLVLELKMADSVKQLIEKANATPEISSDAKLQNCIAKKDIEGCFRLLNDSSLDDSKLVVAINHVRKGFPVSLYGRSLFPYLHLLLEKLCNSLREPSVIVPMMQWYRMVVAEVKSIHMETILLDLQLVIYAYLSEKNVVQTCVNTLLAVSEVTFTPNELEIMCSTDFTYDINNIIKLYRQELWISNFFQFLQQLVFTIKDTKVDLVVSSYHLQLLSSVLISSFRQPAIFRSVCSYLQTIAESNLSSIMLFNSDLLAILASILQKSKTNDAENAAVILRVFLSFSNRKELHNLIMETNITSFLIDLFNLFSSNRMIIQLALSLLHNLVSSTEICCYMYLLNMLDVFQTCLSVYRDSDISIVQSCYSIMYIMLRKNDIAIQYLNESDVELVMNYCMNYYKETAFISVILQFITVIIQRQTYFEMIREKKYEKAFQNLMTVYSSNKMITNMVQYILNKEAIDIPPSEMVFDFPSQDSILNNTVNEEQIMSRNKLYHLLCWRLTHSTNTYLLEAASQTLAVVLANKDFTITETIDYLPYKLFPLFSTSSDSVLLLKAVITILHTILLHNPTISIPSEYVTTLLERVLGFIFNYQFVLKALEIIEIMYNQNPALIQDAHVVLALQRIQYATHSLRCRQIVDTLLEAAPVKTNKYPKRCDTLEATLYNATVHQLASSEQSVVIESLKLCSNAFILAPVQFSAAFSQEDGYIHFIEVFRKWEADEVLHPALDFLGFLHDNKTYAISEMSILPTVVVLYTVLRKKEQCVNCVKMILKMIVRFSTSDAVINRVMNNIDTLIRLLAMHAVNSGNDSISVEIVNNVLTLLTLFAIRNSKGLQTLRNKDVIPTLAAILSQAQDREVCIPCIQLFLLLKGEQIVATPYPYLMEPCIMLLHTERVDCETLFQIIEIFSKILEYDHAFVNHPIHKMIILQIGNLPADILFGLWGNQIIHYLTVLAYSPINQSIFITSSILPNYMSAIQLITDTLDIESVVNVLYLLTVLVVNPSIKQYLRSQFEFFISLSNCYFDNESILELVLRILLAISGTNNILVLKPMLADIANNYASHKDIQAFMEAFDDKWHVVEYIDTTSLLGRACTFLISSTERDIEANLEVMLEILNSDDLDPSIIPQIEAIASPLLDWIQTCDFIQICPGKVIELLSSLLSVLLPFATNIRPSFFSVYCCLLSIYYPVLKDCSLFHTVMNILTSYLHVMPECIQDVASMLLDTVVLALNEETEEEGVLLLVNDLITSDSCCQGLAEAHFFDCLFAFLLIFTDIKKAYFILSLLAYLVSYEASVSYLLQPSFVNILSRKKEEFYLEGEAEVNAFVIQILDSIQNNPLEDAFVKAIVQKYGDLPDSIAPECI